MSFLEIGSKAVQRTFSTDPLRSASASSLAFGDVRSLGGLCWAVEDAEVWQRLSTTEALDRIIRKGKRRTQLAKLSGACMTDTASSVLGCRMFSGRLVVSMSS